MVYHQGSGLPQELGTRVHGGARLPPQNKLAEVVSSESGTLVRASMFSYFVLSLVNIGWNLQEPKGPWVLEFPPWLQTWVFGWNLQEPKDPWVLEFPHNLVWVGLNYLREVWGDFE